MKLTQHAKERYANRIAGKKTPTDVAVYINKHEDKIVRDVNKMIQYGELIYKGKAEHNSSLIRVYVNKNWMLIVDEKKKAVVTLYKNFFHNGENYYVTNSNVPCGFNRAVAVA